MSNWSAKGNDGAILLLACVVVSVLIHTHPRSDAQQRRLDAMKPTTADRYRETVARNEAAASARESERQRISEQKLREAALANDPVWSIFLLRH